MENIPTELSSPAVEIDMELSLPPAQDTEMAIHNGAAEQHIKWTVTICLIFASQPVQTTTSSSKTYAEVGLILIMLAFAFLFMAKCRCFDCKTSGVMQRLGVFFGVTAFFVRVTTQSSVWLKCAGGTVYSLTWIVIFVLPLFNKPVTIPPVKQWMRTIWAQVEGNIAGTQ